MKVKPLDDFVYLLARHLVENKYENDAVSNFHLAVSIEAERCARKLNRWNRESVEYAVWNDHFS